MIKLTAKKEGKAVKLKIRILGEGGNVAEEAAAIVLQVPKRLLEIDEAVFRKFKEAVASKIDEEFNLAEEKVEEDDNEE